MLYLPVYAIYFKARGSGDRWQPGYPPAGVRVAVISSVAGMTPAELAQVKKDLNEEQHKAAAAEATRRGK